MKLNSTGISRRLSFKLVLSSAVGIALFVVALTVFFYIREIGQIQKRFGWALQHTATTAALGISGEDHEKIREFDDYQKEEFRRIRGYLERVREGNKLTYDTIYTFQIDPGEEAPVAVRFGVMLHEKPFVGHSYKLPAHIRPWLHKALQGEPAHTDLYEDANGEWISGYAPILGKRGEVKGLLAVDYEAEELIAVARRGLIQVVAIGLLFLLAGIGLAYLFARGISKPVEELSRAALGIANERFDIKVTEDSRKDEIGDLRRSFLSMVNSLQERLLMLQYVSQHTRKMIRRVLNGEISDKGEHVNVAILFSDIRGYTSFSQHNSPERIVTVLNSLLGVQAEIIESCSGQVDKFVGDEIVAIFEGEERVANAVRAALEIVPAVRQLSIREGIANESEPLAVGVGISVGDVVMGSMGSSERKDFTVIGSEVNLASRLCSIAKREQILLTSDVYRAIERHKGFEGVALRLRGTARVKGYSEPIHVYQVGSVDSVRSGSGSGSASGSVGSVDSAEKVPAPQV